MCIKRKYFIDLNHSLARVNFAAIYDQLALSIKYVLKIEKSDCYLN